MSPDQALGRMLLALALAIAVGHILSIGLSRLRQPTVLAQILAGVVLGPTLVGAIPGAEELLFPAPVTQALAAIGSVGLVLFMFMVGVELDLSAVRRMRGRTAAISAGALGLPFALGLGAAAVLYESHRTVAGAEVDRLPFFLFVATALSITAFPVLARIIRDHRMERSPVAQMATASAAVQDGAGWLLLAVALAAMSADGSTQLLHLVAWSAGLVVVLLVVVRPLLRRTSSTTTVLVGLAACAGATQLIGLHSALGAFLFGALIPGDARAAVAERFERMIMPTTAHVLLPLFFLGPGLHVNLRALDGGALVALALIMACACGGKLVGGAIPARLGGASWHDAKVIAVLLNTRGLVELIVLEVGRVEGILDPMLYSVLVTMALTTTLMTGPLLYRLEGSPESRVEVTRPRVLAAEAQP
ncbi:MAG TPA: cation:proton antiporter [Conexibacter sp.]|nr:cation:proton antiporter [Conexibacter sp.]